MGQNHKNFRIKTNVGNSSYNLNINLEQQYDILEILSLNINMTNTYKLFSSDYGVLVGRVYANGGFGVPNAKVSAFIKKNSEFDDILINTIYPYFNTSAKNSDGIRYNLLPNEDVNDCHNSVGTFPTKRLVLDDNRYLEIFETYYKYTTVTNTAGDYMLFGLPVGNQTIHMDVDLSDIGVLSQKPRDFIYKGYDANQFENPNQFKTDKNLDNLVQIITQNTPTYVYPFWGDESENEIGLTRLDMELSYKFEPTCVFMGSIITDKEDIGITKYCRPKSEIGVMSKLSTGDGTIEMIRKKPDNTVEEIQVKGNQLIDSNGVWCYQIPMNLDYMTTDEYGRMVPTDDTSKGIPTRTKARFRISKNNSGGEYANVYKGKMLVPNNPKIKSEIDYAFGSSTLDTSYRNLLWNNVYTVKSFIPRFQKYNKDGDKKFTGIKNVSNYGQNSPVPYNNFRIYNRFMFTLMCNITKFIISLTKIYNKYVVSVIPEKVLGYKIWTKRCLSIPDGYCDGMEGWSYAPGCKNKKGFNNLFKDLVKGDAYFTDVKSTDNINGEKQDSVCLTTNTDYLLQCVEIQLAQEYGLINFDFYNDWLNGTIYIPQFHRHVKRKKSYFFNLIKTNGGIRGCFESKSVDRMRFTQQCALTYEKNEDNTSAKITSPLGCISDKMQLCHKGSGRKSIGIFGDNGGLMHIYKNLKKQEIYYYKPIEITYNKTIPLFLTDIVLLGSIDENNIYGIPRINDEIPSTTYQLPEDLALTNADEVGYTFGLDKNGTRCSGMVNQDVKMVLSSNPNLTGDTTSYANALKNADPNYDSLSDYSDTNLVTIMSGIDWGYSGPKQLENKLSDLYFPGGNFLSIACSSAASNIKSCVNLTRACELGVMLDQIQEMEKSSSDTLIINPDGLISKDEILDGDYRAIFSTLNSNNLLTKYDSNTGYLNYDFTYRYPMNFDGSLMDKLNKTNKTYDKLNPNRIKLEYQDVDYYKFRMGTTPAYLINLSNGNVALPVYENSFYFYFGLKDGNSAIDRFYKEFYSSCKKNKTESFSISTSAYSATVCGEDDGVIIFKSDDAYLPISWFLYDVNENQLASGDTREETSEYIILNNSGTISGLTNQEYTLELVDSKFRSVTKIIDLKTPEITSQFDVFNLYTQKSEFLTNENDYQEFRSAIFDNILSGDSSYGGYLSVSNILMDGNDTPITMNANNINNKLFILVVRYKDNGDVSEYISNSANTINDASLPNLNTGIRLTGNTFAIKDSSMIIPAWETNVLYEIFIAQKCNNIIGGNFYNYRFEITEPKKLELVFNGTYYRDIDNFKTGIFSGETKVIGFNRLSSELSYDWDTITDNFINRGFNSSKFGNNGVPSISVGDCAVVANRDAFIRNIKKSLWFDDYIENVSNFYAENGTQPYISTIIYNQESVDDNGSVSIGDNVLNINNIIQTQQIPTIIIGDESISASNGEKILNDNGIGKYPTKTIYGFNDDSNIKYYSVITSANQNIATNSPIGTNVKTPYFGFVTDYSGRILPENASGVELPISDINLKNWFGIHKIYKPFYIDFTLIKGVSKSIYYHYGLINTLYKSNFLPMINGNIHNGATNRKYLARDFYRETNFYNASDGTDIYKNNGKSYLGDCFLVNLDKNNIDIYQNTLYRLIVKFPTAYYDGGSSTYGAISYVNSNKYNTAYTNEDWVEYESYEDLYYAKKTTYITLNNVLATKLYGDKIFDTDTKTVAENAQYILEFDNEIPNSIISGGTKYTKQNTVYDDYCDGENTILPIKPISGRTFDWTNTVQTETTKLINFSDSKNFMLHISEPNIPSNTIFGDNITPEVLEYNLFIQDSSDKTIVYNMIDSNNRVLSIRINDYDKGLNNEYYLIPSSVTNITYNDGNNNGVILYPFYLLPSGAQPSVDNVLFDQFLRNEDLQSNQNIKHIVDGNINMTISDTGETSYFIVNNNEIITHENPINNKTRVISSRAFSNTIDLKNISTTLASDVSETSSGYVLTVTIQTENWYLSTIPQSSITENNLFNITINLRDNENNPLVGYPSPINCATLEDITHIGETKTYLAYFLIKDEDVETIISMIDVNNSIIEIFDNINKVKYINNLD